MFNEGVDVPSIDTVMMLRPTESQIVWLQQLGRGLRKQANKKLTVIDYIGNHRTFLVKPRTLLGLPLGSDHQLNAALEKVARHEWELPPGCEVTYETQTIDILRGLLRLGGAVDHLKAYYEDFRVQTGSRPLAVETLRDGYTPRAVTNAHGSWLGFVEAMGDLDANHQAALVAARDFLRELEVTKMTRGYKMLVLLAMLEQDALPGNISIADLARCVSRLAEHSESIRVELGDALASQAALEVLLEKNPINALTGGNSSSTPTFFDYQRGVLSSRFSIPQQHREAFQDLARELVEWRLADYFAREGSGTSGARFVAKVTHNASGSPMLFLPDRSKVPGIPLGKTPVVIEGQQYEADFVSIALNVVKRPGEQRNEFPEILRRWFGPNAGASGTSARVSCEQTPDGYLLKPVSLLGTGAELWRSYMREEIPTLFGDTFSDSIWNQGFVARPPNLFLLVTLEKEGRRCPVGC
jgi:hypothetical protein